MEMYFFLGLVVLSVERTALTFVISGVFDDTPAPCIGASNSGLPPFTARYLHIPLP